MILPPMDAPRPRSGPGSNGSDLTPSDEPLDAADRDVLAGLRDTYAAADPVPRGLVDRIRFAVALDDLAAEVGRITELAVSTSVRGGQARAITVDGSGLTVMLQVSPVGETAVRMDGWIAPAGGYSAELRLAGDRLHTDSDERGRFAFDRVARGNVQVLVTPAGSGPALVTPAFTV